MAKQASEFEQFKQNEERKLKDQAKRAEEDRKNLDNQKKQLQDKDSRLEVERKNLEKEIQKGVEALRTQLVKEGKSAELVRLLIASAVCLLVGLLAAQFVLRQSA